jgi:gliding motility-associated-like protein
LIHVSQVHAQCCSNGVNLLSAYNPNFSDTFSTIPHGFTNDNTYSSSAGAGYYTIISSRGYGACAATPEYDHTTGNGTGKYLWFDTPPTASAATPAVAWMPYNPALPAGSQNLITVTPNTTYVFSVWIRDLARNPDCVSGGAPVMGLRINGVDMAQIDLGQTTSPCCPQWTYLCSSWNSGSSTTALIKIESRSGVGFTDLGIDDVYFGTTAVDYSGVLGNDTTICTGQNAVIGDSVIGATYLWSTGATTPRITVNTTGLYWEQISQGTCVGRDSIRVTFNTCISCPTLTISHDTTVCPNTTFALHSAISSGTVVTRAWAPKYGLNDSSLANPTVTVAHDTFYTCTVTTSSTTNLITNGNFSNGNTGFSSGYAYTNVPPSAPCGTYGILGCEAYYTVNTNPRNTHSQFAVYGDHTSGGGQMLIVNGATSPNISVWCQNITVQPNTNYQFSAWVSNVDLNPQPLPNLQFQINGVAAGAHFSPVITAGVWTQFYILWNSGSNTNINICLTDSSNAAGGNDFALDDISFVPICRLVDTVHITTFVKPTVTLPADTTFCDSVFRLINSTVTGTGTLSYYWLDATTQHTDTARQPGVYWLQVSNQCANSAARDSMLIFKLNSPTVRLGADTLVCNQPSDLLKPIVTGSSPITFQWQDATTDSTYTATTTNLYAVRVTNVCGAASDTVSVKFDARPVISPSTSLIPKCNGDSVIITSPTPANDTAIWQDGSRGPTYLVTGSGTYFYEWANDCGVSLVGDTFVYAYIGPPAASTLGPPDTLMCNGSSVTLAPTPVPAGATFQWQGPGTTSADSFAAYTTAAHGLYILQVSNRCGILFDSIRVDTLLTPAPFSIGQSQGLCVGSDLTLTVAPLPDSGNALLWQDGVTTTDTFLVTTAGTYTLTESNHCGSNSASVTISPLFAPTIGLDTLPVQCDVDSVQLSPVATDALSYQWSTGSTDPSVYVHSTGIYRVTVSNQCGTADTSVTVIMRRFPIRPYNDAVIDSCIGAKVILNAQNPGMSFQWSHSETTQLITVTDTGVYTVVISDSDGLCPITDAVVVIGHRCDHCRVAVPTAFSPNGDGRNDRFRIFFECQPEAYVINIYDRWGELVYQSDNLTDGWDGFYRNVSQPIGVYIFFVHYRESGTNEEKSMSGNITLLK